MNYKFKKGEFSINTLEFFHSNFQNWLFYYSISFCVVKNVDIIVSFNAMQLSCFIKNNSFKILIIPCQTLKEVLDYI